MQSCVPSDEPVTAKHQDVVLSPVADFEEDTVDDDRVKPLSLEERFTQNLPVLFRCHLCDYDWACRPRLHGASTCCRCQSGSCASVSVPDHDLDVKRQTQIRPLAYYDMAAAAAAAAAGPEHTDVPGVVATAELCGSDGVCVWRLPVW